jgi:hypothetical protein
MSHPEELGNSLVKLLLADHPVVHEGLHQAFACLRTLLRDILALGAVQQALFGKDFEHLIRDHWEEKNGAADEVFLGG